MGRRPYRNRLQPGPILCTVCTEDMEQLGMAASSPCYGIIGQKWIPTFLRMAKVSVRADTLEGRAVYVLRGVNGDVEIDLWLDPSLEYAARRISFQKRASADDATVYTHQLDATRFRQKAGRYLVTEATITFTRGPQPLFSPMIVEKVVDGKRVVTHPLAKDESGNVVDDPPGSVRPKDDVARPRFRSEVG